MPVRRKRKATRGSIGLQTFAEVERLTVGGKVTRQAAFEAIAKRSGKNAGTISANFYRVARQRGAVKRHRRRGAPKGGGGAGGLGARIAHALQAIKVALQAQHKEIAQLRRDSARWDAVRRLVAM